MNPQPSETRDLLHARARALAQPLQIEKPTGGSIEVVEFVLASERYAIPGAAVREVAPLKEFSPIPCTPPFYLGMLNVRGQIVAVIDLRRFFDLPIAGLSDMNKVIILESDGVQIGILADAIVDVRAILLQDIQPPLPTLSGIRAEFLRGVTGESLVILDADKILTDPKLVVNQEVAT